jgi:hypothetical protein
MSNPKEIKSLFIEARTWFDKTGGTSYFSARIEADGKLIGRLPFQYGYGNQYEYEATKWLLDNGYLSERIEPLWRLRDKGVAVYSVIYETNKRDAQRWGQD